MNKYVLSSFIAFVMLGMGLSSFIMGIINHSENKESKSGAQMLYLLACSFFWDFGYAWMSLCFDSDFAYVPRAMALLAVTLYCIFLVRYIAALVNYPSKKLIPFYIVYGISGAVSWVKIIQKSAVTFSTTAWGYWYTSSMTWGRALQFFAVLLATLMFYIILAYGLKNAKLARDRYILKGYIWFAPVLYAGYIADTLIPSIFNTPAVPGSAIGAFFATILLFRLSKNYKAFGISKDNISEFVFQDVSVPVIISDYKDNIALFNSSVPTFFECDENDLNQANIKSFLMNKGAIYMNDADDSADDEAGENDNIISFKSKNGNDIVFKMNNTEVHDRFNELMYTISFVQDLTLERARLKQIEESKQIAEDANMAKSNFLANMSHEIRTPMNAIIGMSEIILQNNPENEVVEEVSEIKVAANNLLGIINDILDISKIEAGKYEIIPDEYGLSSLINDVCTIIRIRLQETNTKFVLDIDSSLPAKLIGDQTRVRQILLNILGNAVKFTKQGSVTLKIRWNADKVNPELYFDVIDTGIGIKPEDIDNIFGAFNQVDTRRNRSIQGTGLGLAISKELAKLMDGDLYVESVYEKGSTFHIVIKQKIENYKELGEKISKALVDANFTSVVDEINTEDIKRPNAKVLVVDDVEMNLIIAQGLLKKYDIDADIADSGKAAIEMAANTDYDLIFMDHMMPEMDGVDTTRAIRNIEGGKHKNTTIVALTANALNEAKELFFEEGMQDFLAKPIESKRLDEIIVKWL